MVSFKERSFTKELLDGDNNSFADIQQNMQELDAINHLLGGHSITIKGLEELLKNQSLKSGIHIVEIGCGGGDNLRVLKKYALKKGLQFTLTGIDINRDCIQFAKSRNENKDIQFIGSDYAKVVFNQPPHIIFSSLFCHHFGDEELVQMLQWMAKNSSTGFFINDLHRHPLAYYSIKTLTRFFSKSRLVKNDAPLSVQRGFVKKDWMDLIKKSGLKNVSCRWHWAFRWLLIYKKA